MLKLTSSVVQLIVRLFSQMNLLLLREDHSLNQLHLLRTMIC